MRSTTGHTFGGYASASWDSANAGAYGTYIYAAGCFLFLVENPHGDAPTFFECNVNGHAMFSGKAYGPLFGAGNDLRITSDGNSSYFDFPNCYIDTLGRGNATFTGAKNFTPQDYEVWAAT